MHYEDIKVHLPTYNLTLALKRWGDPSSSNIVLALHGWLDNSASFDPLASVLDLENVQLYALDFTGHGFSDHLPEGSAYDVLTCMEHLVELIDILKWPRFHLLGHSLGACVSTLFAGLFPNLLKTLSLIEGVGPLTLEDEKLPERLQKYLLDFRKRKDSHPKIHASIEAAAKARAKNSNVTLEAARLLAERGTKKKEGGFVWRTDPRLLVPSRHPLTEKQVHAFLSRITCPTLIFQAEQGIPTEYLSWQERVLKVGQHRLVHIPGSHHAHMEYPDTVAKELNPFFKS
jgi:pimeloyl-ACP methyl ester carboxylesterase